MNKKDIKNPEILQVLKVDKMEGIHLLFDRYYISLVVFAEQYIHDRGRAEDIVQEFYVRLWEDNYLLTLSDKVLTSYLFNSVRNACFTFQHKKDTLRRAINLSEVEIPVEAFLETEDERVGKILEEIQKLPERTRLVVEEVLLKERKQKEVASELGISVNTVKFLLREGTHRLRQKLNHNLKNIFLFFFRKKNTSKT